MTAYPMFRVHVDAELALGELRTVLESGFVNEGRQVAAFQKALVRFLGVDQLVLVNSCTSALTVALKLCGVGPGADVVTTPMTCVATNTPIENLGARIVWADIDPTSACLDAKEVERKLTPATKAIVTVSWAGTPCDLDGLGDVSRRCGIPLIHDAAHAFGATWRGRPLSEFADFTCYSFQAIKHLSSGDGGAIVCRDPEKFVLARKLKWFGYDRDAHKDANGEWKGQRWNADIEAGEVGFKFNMNNVAAAIGLSQMPHIARILAGHRSNGAVYSEAFKSSRTVRKLRVPDAAFSSYWVYTALTEDTVDRDQLLNRLNEEGIAAGVVHLPNTLYSAFDRYKCSLPGVDYFAARQISLPCGWWLSEADCLHIARRVEELASATPPK